ncbi:Nn.00g107040.m01.CDS01 [Neocucurbitaria sp. VM-36]
MSDKILALSPPRINANPFLRDEYARKHPLIHTVSSEPRLINTSWYKNPKLIDVTIVYGKQGEHQFEGHRFVLCNSSEWFMNASSNPVVEAQDRVITLKEDHPDALEALFELFYTGDYTETTEGDDLLDWTRNIFMQHARVFIAPDKYIAYSLKALALDRFKNRLICEAQNGSRLFLKFAIEELYLNDNLFGYKHNPIDKVEQYTKGLANAQSEGNDIDSDADKEAGEEAYTIFSPEIVAESDDDEDDSDKDYSGEDDGYEHSDDGSLEIEDFDSDQDLIDSLLQGEPSRHPLERLRAIVVGALIDVVLRGEAEFNGSHIAV